MMMVLLVAALVWVALATLFVVAVCLAAKRQPYRDAATAEMIAREELRAMQASDADIPRESGRHEPPHDGLAPAPAR
jgi:hypothetical protein